MKLILISPHRDDAAFSCGILLSLCRDAHVNVQVLNVFTLSDYAPFAEPSTANLISQLRKTEDDTLQSLLADSLSFLDLGLHDAPLRFQIPAEQTLGSTIDKSICLRELEDLEKRFQPLLTAADCVLIPAAIGAHVDHLIVRDAALRCVPIERVALYEDLPYASRLSESQRAAHLEPFVNLQPVPLSRTNGSEIKNQFASCYRSQVAGSTVDEMVAYAAERNGGEIFHAGQVARNILSQILSQQAAGPS